MGKINDTDFFKKKIDEDTSAEIVPVNFEMDKRIPKFHREIQLSQTMIAKAKNTASTLLNNGFKALANEVIHATKSISKEHFTVAFVGEFNRGKSTLINRIIGRDILPTGNLPTTALLTLLSYAAKDSMTVISANGKTRNSLPLEKESWSELVASNFGENEPEGHVLIGIADSWLGKYGIDILDTPGAGDLEEKRVRVIENCLLGADAAIIAISAEKPFSLTEQTFIRHKILSKGTPFFAIAITQLDRVEESKREEIVSYIYTKLEEMKVSMPVLVIDDSLIGTCGKYNNIVGNQTFKKLVYSWITHEERRNLTDKWLLANLNRIVDMAMSSLLQQKKILDAKGEEREQLIANRNASLVKVDEQWGKVRDEMRARCDACIKEFHKKAENCGEAITQALQHEVNMRPNPKEWLDKEYSYRVKRELSGLSLTLDSLVMHRLTKDVQWMNGVLKQQFNEVLSVEPRALDANEVFVADVNNTNLGLSDIKDVTNKNKVLSTAATLGLALPIILSGAGILTIVATLGVGTGASIISQKVVDKKVEEQRERIQSLIAEEMPCVIMNATSDSEVKIKILYNEAISEAFAAENRWMQTQRTLIRQSLGKKYDEAVATLQKQIEEIQNLKQQL